VPDSWAAVQPVPLHGAQHAKALTVTAAKAPGLHCANPLWPMVATLGSDNDHPVGVIWEGDGG